MCYAIGDWLANSILIERDISRNDVRDGRKMGETAPQLSKGPALNSVFFPHSSVATNVNSRAIPEMLPLTP